VTDVSIKYKDKQFKLEYNVKVRVIAIYTYYQAMNSAYIFDKSNRKHYSYWKPHMIICQIISGLFSLVWK